MTKIFYLLKQNKNEDAKIYDKPASGGTSGDMPGNAD